MKRKGSREISEAERLFQDVTKKAFFERLYLVLGLSPKEKKILFLVLSPRPGPDGPNASGWYRRLREPI